jgi:2-hydroxy-6-oxonona-2,4-dienedioate hydrolase
MSADVAAYREGEATFWAWAGRRPRREHHVRLPTTGTTVRIQEVGDGPPVLFLHGAPNSGSTWVPLVAHLDRMRCLLVDRPGTGLSAPYPISIANLPRIGARFVPELLDGLGIGRAHVVASSFGGHLALRSAAAHPERFLRMVQLGAPALIPGDSLPLFLRLMARSSVRRLLGMLPPSERGARSILRQIGHRASLDRGRIPEGFLAWYVALQRYTDTMCHDGEMIGAAVPRFDEVRLTDELLASVRVPTLFWWGADDAFGDEGVARHLAEVMRDAQVRLVPDAGHLPWLDDAAAVASATTAFLGAEVVQR